MTFTITEISSDLGGCIGIFTKHANRKKFAAFFPSAREIDTNIVSVAVTKRDLFSAMRDISDVVNNELHDECIFDMM